MAVASGRSGWKVVDLLLAAVWAVTLVLMWFVRHDVRWFAENCTFENIQLVSLLLAAGLFARCATRPPDRRHRLELFGIALFTFCMAVREADVRHTWAEPYLGDAQKHGWQWMAVTPLWLLVIGFSLPRVWPTLAALLRWLLTPAGALMFGGGVWYLLGDRAEKGWFSADADTSKIVEESCETVGCLCILTASYLVTRLGFRPLGKAPQTDGAVDR